jgi:O-methyltransferase involved in polyketide biosynthesis
VLFLAEGISMYLTEDQGIALLGHVVDRFGSGEIQIDFFNWLAIKSQKTQTLVRRSGSTLYWAVNSPQDILGRVPGLRLRESATFFDARTFARVTARFRAAKRAAKLAPALRKALQYHVYEFGRPS